MSNKTKAAFKWIASTAIVMGMMVQPAQAGERHHYTKHHHYYKHQHDSYCRHGNRQHLNYFNSYQQPKRNYYKHNLRQGHRIRHYNQHGYRGRNGTHSGLRYKERGGRYIKIRF